MSYHVHSLNVSPAHQKFSFGKGQRFIYDKPRTDVYYAIDGQKDRRSAIIGYGRRSLDMMSSNNKTIANSPHAYSIPSSIQQKRGYSFKAGRHLAGSPFEEMKVHSFIPGPSAYTAPSTLSNQKYSLGIKVLDTSDKYLKSIPGPGAYSIPSSIDNGQKGIFESQFSNKGSIRIPPLSHSYEISRIKQKPLNPGPGQYDIQKYGIGNPENPLQKRANIRIGKQRRADLAIKGAEKIPGPGQYKIYSEFDN